jgi:uncharacterized membrane protein YfcA
MDLPAEPLFYAVAYATIFVISFLKGGFGGGFATLGIPFLAIVMDPIEAAIVMAPLVALQDVFAIRAYPPRTWSVTHLKVLGPALLVGLGIGFLAFIYIDRRLVVLAIATITLVFTLRWFANRYLRRVAAAPPPSSPPRLSGAFIWGAMAGFTTFVAHSGGPPLQIYLLRQGLTKTVYAGTTVAFFAMGNVLKVGPYLWLGLADPHTLWIAAILSPAVPVGIWLGRRMHDRLEAERLYLICYAMLLLSGVKLMYDGVSGFVG